VPVYKDQPRKSSQALEHRNQTTPPKGRAQSRIGKQSVTCLCQELYHKYANAGLSNVLERIQAHICAQCTATHLCFQVQPHGERHSQVLMLNFQRALMSSYTSSCVCASSGAVLYSNPSPILQLQGGELEWLGFCFMQQA